MRYSTLLLFVIGSLLAFSCAHAGPADEFLQGKKAKYDTTGHAKAKGLEMTFYYPQSWQAVEGERPNVIQKFVSENGRGLENVVVGAKSLNLPQDYSPSEQELKEAYDGIVKGIVPKGATGVETRQTKVEGIPAVMVEYSLVAERAGLTFKVRVLMLAFYHKGLLVTMGCTTGADPATGLTAEEKMTSFKPLFLLMMNSIVLPSKWK